MVSDRPDVICSLLYKKDPQAPRATIDHGLSSFFLLKDNSKTILLRFYKKKSGVNQKALVNKKKQAEIQAYCGILRKRRERKLEFISRANII